jgi:hypothetical protein
MVQSLAKLVRFNAMRRKTISDKHTISMFSALHENGDEDIRLHQINSATDDFFFHYSKTIVTILFSIVALLILTYQPKFNYDLNFILTLGNAVAGALMGIFLLRK